MEQESQGLEAEFPLPVTHSLHCCKSWPGFFSQGDFETQQASLGIGNFRCETYLFLMKGRQGLPQLLAALDFFHSLSMVLTLGWEIQSPGISGVFINASETGRSGPQHHCPEGLPVEYSWRVMYPLVCWTPVSEEEMWALLRSRQNSSGQKTQ